MLTARENFLETIRGGTPDRFVNQYEALHLIVPNPISIHSAYPQMPGDRAVDAWGVTHYYAPGTPGPFPVHEGGLKVVDDITRWCEVVKAPELIYPDEAWEAMRPRFVDCVDRSEQLVTLMYPVGLFERAHYLMGIEDCLMNFYEEPEEMHALLDYLTEYEIGYAEQVCAHWPIEAVFHHDDWGTQINSFMSPDMFREFFVPRYKKIYDTYRKHGVKVIIHHNDSYGANLVPCMIEMGIDVWQGCITSNDLPALIKQYGGRISFMGGINNGVVDRVDWTQEHIDAVVAEQCAACGKHYFIPCMCAGTPGSAFPGVYEAVCDAIAKYSAQHAD